MNFPVSGSKPKLSTNVDDAVQYLHSLVCKDWEFPDAEIKVLTVYNVKIDALRSAYDQRF